MNKCSFTSTDLSLSSFGIGMLGLNDWKCSRRVWEKHDEVSNRCVWHADTTDKPQNQLKNTIKRGDLHGVIVHSETDLSGFSFPDRLDSMTLTCRRRRSGVPTCRRRTSGMLTCRRQTSRVSTPRRQTSGMPTCRRGPSMIPIYRRRRSGMPTYRRRTSRMPTCRERCYVRRAYPP